MKVPTQQNNKIPSLCHEKVLNLISSLPKVDQYIYTDYGEVELYLPFSCFSCFCSFFMFRAWFIVYSFLLKYAGPATYGWNPPKKRFLMLYQALACVDAMSRIYLSSTVFLRVTFFRDWSNKNITPYPIMYFFSRLWRMTHHCFFDLIQNHEWFFHVHAPIGSHAFLARLLLLDPNQNGSNVGFRSHRTDFFSFSPSS